MVLYLPGLRIPQCILISRFLMIIMKYLKQLEIYLRNAMSGCGTRYSIIVSDMRHDNIIIGSTILTPSRATIILGSTWQQQPQDSQATYANGTCVGRRAAPAQEIWERVGM